MDKQAAQRVVGQTRDVGFQIGVRRSFTIEPQQAWYVLTSDQGLRLWLGDVSGLRLEPGTQYHTRDGTHGEIRVVKPGGHVRMSWQPRGWANPSTLQVRVLPGSAAGKAVISFHQEKLRDARQREQMHQRWLGALDRLEDLIRE